MKRAPFVVAATGAGLGLLFSYHTRPIRSAVTTAPATTAPTTGTTPTTGSPSATAPTTTSPSGASDGTGTTAPATTSPTTAAPNSRTATGQDVQYRYGDLQLQVVESGSHITAINVVADDATDPRSEQINSQALPQLQSEAMSAQSADIDGVSGATFTSMAYQQALQSALDQAKS
ncbi:MAG TPA: FMN-binding protein [Acidimicrobiales bacterium]|nr:FMN-binding protein [Acidimicrobiales bacterium]